MLVFPQLGSKCIAQYPLVCSRTRRTIRNTCGDGSVIRFADSDQGRRNWLLNYVGLTRLESDELRQLFKDARGRFGEFLFVDPGGNSLRNSDRFTDAVWSNASLLTLEKGLADPKGASGATRVTNSHQTALLLSQRVEAPSWFTWCFSLYARAQQSVAAKLQISSDTVVDFKRIELGTDWRRLTFTTGLSSSTIGTTCGLVIDPGTQCDVFGMQLEAQSAASAYMRTEQNAGVFPRARFDQDDLSILQMDSTRYNATVRISATEEGIA